MPCCKQRQRYGSASPCNLREIDLCCRRWTAGKSPAQLVALKARPRRAPRLWAAPAQPWQWNQPSRQPLPVAKHSDVAYRSLAHQMADGSMRSMEAGLWEQNWGRQMRQDRVSLKLLNQKRKASRSVYHNGWRQRAIHMAAGRAEQQGGQSA